MREQVAFLEVFIYNRETKSFFSNCNKLQVYQEKLYIRDEKVQYLNHQIDERSSFSSTIHVHGSVTYPMPNEVTNIFIQSLTRKLQELLNFPVENTNQLCQSISQLI